MGFYLFGIYFDWELIRSLLIIVFVIVVLYLGFKAWRGPSNKSGSSGNSKNDAGNDLLTGAYTASGKKRK